MDVGNEHSADGRQGPSREGGSQPSAADAEVMIIGHEPSQARAAPTSSAGLKPCPTQAEDSCSGPVGRVPRSWRSPPRWQPG